MKKQVFDEPREKLVTTQNRTGFSLSHKLVCSLPKRNGDETYSHRHYV